MENQSFTRAEVIMIIENIFERADAVMDAIINEDPKFDAQDFLEMAEDDLNLTL